MAERTARLGSMLYRDSDGRYRYASAGDTIQVHPDYLERFDRLNHLMGEIDVELPKAVGPVGESDADEVKAEYKPAPKRRGRPRKIDAED